MKGLYIHIPFCNSICTYCDFPKQIAREETKKEYLVYLLAELRKYEEMDALQDIRSVYIGGGTPNCLSLTQLEELFQALEPYLKSSKENTIEINSDLFSEAQAELFQKYHFNRISIGAQTFQSKLIKNIHRFHTFKMVQKTVQILKKHGIQNINIDMMYGIPGETLHDVKKDVQQVLRLKPMHISYYSLILEEKTILEYQLKHHQVELPDDDLVVDMANYLTQKLKKRHFLHYEISNYAKKGYESIHNVGYWKCEEYIGIGSSAASYYNHIRSQNAIHLKDYYTGKTIEEREIKTFESKQEYMMLGLRMLEGVSIKEYYQRYKTYPKDDFDLDILYKKDLIEEVNGFIRIKRNKIWVSNLVFEAFVGGDSDEG